MECEYECERGLQRTLGVNENFPEVVEDFVVLHKVIMPDGLFDECLTCKKGTVERDAFGLMMVCKMKKVRVVE